MAQNEQPCHSLGQEITFSLSMNVFYGVLKVL